MLQHISSLAHASLTTACFTCCMRSCTGSTSQNASSTNWKSQCTTVCSTRLLSNWFITVHQSQTFQANECHLQSATQHHLTEPRHQLSTFGRRAFSVAGPKVWNSLPDSLCDLALSKLLTIAEDEPILILQLSPHSAAEMPHDSAVARLD